MKIVHALAYYGNYLGGIQNYVKELSERQKKQGHEVKIITSDLYGKKKRVSGVEIIRAKTWFSAFRVPFMPSLLYKMLKEDCDVLHVHLPLPGLDISAVLKKLIHKKTKLIITIHNYIPINSKLSSFFAWVHNKILIRFPLMASDAVIVTTKGFSESLDYNIPEGRERIIPLGVDLKYFYPSKKHDKNSVLFVGRMIPEKGLHVLAEAMNSVRKKFKNAQLTAICSETYNYGEYEKKVRKLDKSGFLKIIKNVPHKKIRKYYASSACLVMPSLDLDSFGFVLIEAMACGCPVISSNLPGPSSVVNKKCGIVVPKGNVKKLSEAIISILKDQEKFRTPCIDYARKNFSSNTVYKNVMKVYNEK